MKVTAIVKARMGSTRLPNKVMMPIEDGTPLIEVLLSRLSKATEVDQIVLATSMNDENKVLVDHIASKGYLVYQGNEDDVLDRFYSAAVKYNSDIVVRITGDCPLVDPEIVDLVINEFKATDVDYVSNVLPPTYPDGLDVEVFSIQSLVIAWEKRSSKFEREHVTPYLQESEDITRKNIKNKIDYSKVRWTLDESEDYEVIKEIFDHFSPNIYFNWRDAMNFIKKNPDKLKSNQDFVRNNGATKSTGQKLWKRAKRIIPGGNMLLSKRSEMYLPELWPSYFSKAKGCKVWDLDGNQYTDMSIMGIGTNILGYGHDEVDDVVKNVVNKGNMSTLNCPEEVYLAERLIDIHPWADMVRLARTGGEANTIAIRIARAASGKDKVAICGYHGWHDWYLSANLGDDEKLAVHLLPGLDPKGVPQNLRGTVFPFEYNDYDGLEALVNKHYIGVIKMEVSRNKGPENNFLQKVRNLATERSIVLIFDECTSGFRETFGGLHKKYNVEPDIAMFGKALGNGYAITAIIGKRDVMESAQSTFISSTFWTERIGPAAALKTLEVMEELKSWETITQTGLVIKQNWQQLADKYELKIEQWGLPALAGYTFNSDNAAAYKTFITQEMMAKGILAGDCVYVCTDHSPEIINNYIESLDPIFSIIKDCEEGRDIMDLLKGPICHSGFKRLN